MLYDVSSQSKLRHSFHRFSSFLISVAVSTLILLFYNTNVFSAQITLAWDPNTEPDLAGYKVYYGTASRGYGSPIIVGKVTTHTLTGLTQGQNYFYSVTACDTSGRESEYSNEVSGVPSEPTQVYTVTTNPSGLQITVDGASYTAPRAFSWVAGSTHTVSVSSPQAGGSGIRYVYSSWSDGGGQSHTVTVPSSSTTYTASFGTEYSLTTSVQQPAMGAVTPSGTNWYNSGQTVSVSATANQGYSFSYWTGDLSGTTSPTSITMNGPKNVVGNFTSQQPVSFYTLALTINPAGSGSVVKNPDKVTYGYGDVVQLTAAANQGYTFSNWSGDAGGSTNPISITINGNKTVTSNFTKNSYTLALNINPAGSGSVVKSPDKATYGYGEVVQLTAAVNSGYSFANWSGDAGGSTNPISITINGNKTVTANFTFVAGFLSVTSSEGFISSGNVGGPFSPPSQTYTLQNTGHNEIKWNASKEHRWVSLSHNNGSLLPGASTNVVVSINRFARRLLAGTHTDIITFSNVTNGNGNTSILVVLRVSEVFNSSADPDMDTVSVDGSWVFEISGTDKGGAALWFMNNALYGYGISINNGMFEIEGSYDIDSKGSINGTYTLYDFESLLELGSGNITGKAGKKVTKLNFEINTVNEEPLFIKMKGGRFIEEPVIPTGGMAKITGSRKGTLFPLKVEPSQFDGDIYPHLFKASGPGIILEIGPTEMEGYFFLTQKKKIYGIYQFGGVESELGVFSGKLNPASGIYNLKVMNEE